MGVFASCIDKGLKVVICLSLYYCLPMHLALSQDVEPRSPQWVSQLPPKIQAIRASQRMLAEDQRVSIVETGERGRFLTSIRGVPSEFRDIEFTDDQQLIDAVVPGIYRYYGFTNAESLRFTEKRMLMGDLGYTFDQYINGIKTGGTLSVILDPETRQIVRFQGALDINNDFDVEPRINKENAINSALEFIAAQGDQIEGIYKTDEMALVRSEIVYVAWEGAEGLQPVWRIGLPLLDPPSPDYTPLHFTVIPDGTIRWTGRMVSFDGNSDR